MLAFGLRFSIAILNKKHIDVHNMIKENARKELKKAYSIEKEDIDFKSNESDPSSRNGNYLSSFFPSFLPSSFNNGGIRFCRRYNNYTMQYTCYSTIVCTSQLFNLFICFILCVFLTSLFIIQWIAQRSWGMEDLELIINDMPFGLQLCSFIYLLLCGRIVFSLF